MPIPVELRLLNDTDKVVPRLCSYIAVDAGKRITVRLTQTNEGLYDSFRFERIIRSKSGCKRMVNRSAAALKYRIRLQMPFDVIVSQLNVPRFQQCWRF